MTESEKNRQESWARPVGRMKVSHVPQGAINLNVEGRQPVSPLQGFGPLWQKTYRILLRGVERSPEEVMALWKENFPRFQPEGNRFYTPVGGVKPGGIIFIQSAVSPKPGRLPGIPVSSGVMVIYNDDTTFTIMTPQGFPESGWNSFSTFGDEAGTWAQVQSMARTADPIYEFGFRVMGGSRFQEETWRYVLTSLAAHFGVSGEEVQVTRTCVDPRLQWREARNVWQNAMLRSMAHAPVKAVRNLFGARSGRRPPGS